MLGRAKMESHFTCEPPLEQTQPVTEGPFNAVFACQSFIRHAKNSPEMKKLTMTRQFFRSF